MCVTQEITILNTGMLRILLLFIDCTLIVQLISKVAFAFPQLASEILQLRVLQKALSILFPGLLPFS